MQVVAMHLLDLPPEILGDRILTNWSPVITDHRHWRIYCVHNKTKLFPLFLVCKQIFRFFPIPPGLGGVVQRTGQVEPLLPDARKLPPGGTPA